MQVSLVTRLAIIISSPGPKDNYLPGSLNDPGHITRHLMSPRGGMWRANEIFCLIDPSWKDVHLLLQLYKTDYLFVYFSGHGYMDDDQRRYFCFKNADVEDTVLFNDSPRQLVIGDACREYWPTISGITKEEEFSGYLGDVSARKVFDEAIINSPPGKMIVHATKAGEVAYESNGQGGVFTLALLRSARAYQTGIPYYPVTLNLLIPVTLERLREEKQKQCPEIVHSEGNFRVPFLIDIKQDNIPQNELESRPPATNLPRQKQYPIIKAVAACLIIAGIAGLFGDE